VYVVVEQLTHEEEAPTEEYVMVAQLMHVLDAEAPEALE